MEGILEENGYMYMYGWVFLLSTWDYYNIVSLIAAAAAKSLRLCPTLCDPIDGSPPGSPVPGILQARVLEWVAIAFSISLIGYTPIQKKKFFKKIAKKEQPTQRKSSILHKTIDNSSLLVVSIYSFAMKWAIP